MVLKQPVTEPSAVLEGKVQGLVTNNDNNWAGAGFSRRNEESALLDQLSVAEVRAIYDKIHRAWDAAGGSELANELDELLYDIEEQLGWNA